MATANGGNFMSKGARKKGREKVSMSATNREMASANNTLHAFVGGTQRSWMMNSNTVKAPSIIPCTIRIGNVNKRKSTLPTPPLTNTEQPTNGQPTPNSPGIPNTSLAVTSPRFSTSFESVLPSPAPSEGQPSPAATSTVDTSSHMNPSHHPSPTGNRSPHLPNYAANLERPQATSGEQTHRTSIDQSMHSTDVNSIAGSTRQNGREMLSNAYAGIKKRRLEQTLGNSSTAAAPITASNLSGRVDEGGIMSMPVRTSRPHPINSPLATATATGNPSNALAPHSYPSPPIQHPPPLQSVASRILPSQQASPTHSNPLLASLDKFVQSIGGMHSLNPTESGRIHWVHKAIILEDWCFLHLHQLYCLSSKVDEFQAKFNASPKRFTGFKLLCDLLLGNECVSGRFLRFFENFPGPALPSGSSLFQASVAQSLTFLDHGQRVFNELRDACLARRTSPSVQELNSGPFSSLIIQRIIWISIRRALDRGIDTASAIELEKQFTEHQIAYQKASRQQRETEQYAKIMANQQAIKHIVPEKQFTVTTAPPTGAPQQSSNMRPGTNFPTPNLVNPAQRLTPIAPINHPIRPASLPPAHQINTATTTTRIPAPQVISQPVRRQSASIVPVLTAQQTGLPLSPGSLRLSNSQALLASTVHTPRLPDDFARPHTLVRAPTSSSRSPSTEQGSPSQNRAVPSSMVLPSQPVNSSIGTSARPTLAPPGESATIEPTPKPKPSVDHYISVASFAIRDLALRSNTLCTIKQFLVPDQVVSRLSRSVAQAGSLAPAKRVVHNGSLIYRLRCAKFYPDEEKDIQNDHKWVSKPTEWPEHAFIEVNSYSIALRRKNLYGKDLVTDITNNIIGGVNQVKVAHFGLSNSPSAPIYVMRVEILEAQAYPNLLNRCLNQRLKKDNAKALVLARLNKVEDEELIVESHDLTIQAICPFTHQLIKDPVRGRSCLHLDCFDLSNFLAFRPRRKEREPPLADAWQCPICRGDARPNELIVDEFVAEILEWIGARSKNGEDIREVVIKSDGSWDVKKEEASSTTKSDKATQEKAPSPTEVIMIDD